MKQFTYTLTSPHGIHARPAGLLAKEAARFPGTEITVSHGEKSAGATQLLRLMSLGVKQGDTVTVAVSGGNEQGAMKAMEAFFANQL